MLVYQWGSLAKEARRVEVSPVDDLDQYMTGLLAGFLLPYPAIWNSLGVERNDVRHSLHVTPRKGIINFTAPKAKAKIKVEVSPNGTHTVTGTAYGVKLNQRFKFRPPMGGVHRGTQGQISSYIEEEIPSKVIYKVYGLGAPQEFKTKEELLRKYKQEGIANSFGLKKELRGQPRLQNLAGPMWDGRNGDIVTVRYDTWDLHDQLSR